MLEQSERSSDGGAARSLPSSERIVGAPPDAGVTVASQQGQESEVSRRAGAEGGVTGKRTFLTFFLKDVFAARALLDTSAGLGNQNFTSNTVFLKKSPTQNAHS